jgi:putative ABC transport system ATP-binding protein
VSDTAGTPPLIAISALKRAYVLAKDHRVDVLHGIDLTVERGDFMALMGPSGSGKSTLMHIVGFLDRPDGGSYRFEGTDVTGLDDAALSRLRGSRVGFVFQSFNLIPQLSIVENTSLPLSYLGVPGRERGARARAALERMGLGHRLRHRPNQLSGGEMQRVAIARALVTEPAMLLADEPTGNLDTATGASIMALFAELHAKGLTIIMVTHDEGVAARARRVLRMRDGAIVGGAP